MASPLFTVRDVQARLRIGKPDGVLALIHGGNLAAVNVSAWPGRPTWRVDPAALAEFLERRRSVPVVAKPVPRTRRPKLQGVTKYF